VDSTKSALLNPLLTALLGSNTKIALSAVDYNGLAQTQVSLANLMVAANVTNLHDLLALHTDLPGALQILGNALQNVGGGTSQAAAGLVSGLAGQAASNGDLTPFGDLFANLGTALNPTVTDVLSAVPIVNGLQLWKPSAWTPRATSRSRCRWRSTSRASPSSASTSPYCNRRSSTSARSAAPPPAPR
jgi:hypothetical protein